MPCITHHLPLPICHPLPPSPNLYASLLTVQHVFSILHPHSEQIQHTADLVCVFGCLEMIVQTEAELNTISCSVWTRLFAPVSSQECMYACSVMYAPYININVYSQQWSAAGVGGLVLAQTAAPWEEIPPQHHSWWGSYAWTCSLWEGERKGLMLYA